MLPRPTASPTTSSPALPAQRWLPGAVPATAQLALQIVRGDDHESRQASARRSPRDNDATHAHGRTLLGSRAADRSYHTSRRRASPTWLRERTGKHEAQAHLRPPPRRRAFRGLGSPRASTQSARLRGDRLQRISARARSPPTRRCSSPTSAASACATSPARPSTATARRCASTAPASRGSAYAVSHSRAQTIDRAPETAGGPLVDPSADDLATRAARGGKKCLEIERADARTRTGDPFITSEVLYQLSYVGSGFQCSPEPRGSLAGIGASTRRERSRGSLPSAHVSPLRFARRLHAAA